jgi:hypothetical protein
MSRRYIVPAAHGGRTEAARMQNISSLAYADFVMASRAGSVDVEVHPQLASHVMDTTLIPKDYRFAYRLWTWVWLSLVPVALAIGDLFWWWTPAL